ETTPVTLAASVLVLVAVWLVGWWRVRADYVRQLGRSLRQMKLAPERDTISLRERGALRELVQALESPYERVVLQALDMLEENAPGRIAARLPGLLEHPSARVRARALAIAADSPAPEAREHVVRRLHDRDPMVRLQALRAQCALGPGRPLQALDEFLE